MEINTHHQIDSTLCGKPVMLEPGVSRVEMLAVPQMAADDSGLVHGGFVFGQADYAAMLAVNHPNVVLGGADVKFLKPVVVGDRLVAEAKVEEDAGKKKVVPVVVFRDQEPVFNGTFTCFVLPQHVLA
jgi:acyl-coenzyme A thioesterase PaaI-like protein